jgi:hypothetical protein
MGEVYIEHASRTQVIVNHIDPAAVHVGLYYTHSIRWGGMSHGRYL